MLGTELIDELVEGDCVAGLWRPHTTTPRSTTRVGYLLVLTPRTPVDPDAQQAVKPARIQFGGHHPFARPADGSPETRYSQTTRSSLSGWQATPGTSSKSRVSPAPGRANGTASPPPRRSGRPGGAAERAARPATPQVEVPPPRRPPTGVVARAGLVTTVRAHQTPPTQRHGDGDT